MQRATRSGHVRLFLLSHADLITRVLTLYRVKLTQSAAFEELPSEPRNSPAVLEDLLLLLVTITRVRQVCSQHSFGLRLKMNRIHAR